MKEMRRMKENWEEGEGGGEGGARNELQMQTKKAQTALFVLLGWKSNPKQPKTKRKGSFERNICKQTSDF